MGKQVREPSDATKSMTVKSGALSKMVLILGQVKYTMPSINLQDAKASRVQDDATEEAMPSIDLQDTKASRAQDDAIPMTIKSGALFNGVLIPGQVIIIALDIETKNLEKKLKHCHLERES